MPKYARPVFPPFERFNERVRAPGGFRLYNPASERRWATPGGRARFVAHRGVLSDPRSDRRDALLLATIRSHDQYNTTIYSFNDRYRGITGRRDILFANAQDLAERGIKHGDLVDVETIEHASAVGSNRCLRRLTAVAYDIARGSVAAYYPEANRLVGLADVDARSGTPSYKSIPVLLTPSCCDGAQADDAKDWQDGDVADARTGVAHAKAAGNPPLDPSAPA